jgi:hypothetical protein
MARRAEALRLAAGGLSNIAISKILGVAESTIRNDLDSQNCESRRRRNRRNSPGFVVSPDSQPCESASLGGPPLRIESDSQSCEFAPSRVTEPDLQPCESAPSRLSESVARIASIVAVIPACRMSDLEEFYACGERLAALARAAGDRATAEAWDDLCRRLASEAQRRAAPAREGEALEAR